MFKRVVVPLDQSDLSERVLPIAQCLAKYFDSKIQLVYVVPSDGETLPDEVLSQALEEGGTFLFPVTDNASEIANIMAETFDAIFLGQTEPADALPAANEEVNATFE